MGRKTQFVGSDGDRMRTPQLFTLLALASQTAQGFPPQALSALREGQPWKHRLAQEEGNTWSPSGFLTESFRDKFKRMREAAMERRNIRDHALSLTEDIEIKSLDQLPHFIDIVPHQKHFRGKRSPGRLVSAEFHYEDGEEVSGAAPSFSFTWDE